MGQGYCLTFVTCVAPQKTFLALRKMHLCGALQTLRGYFIDTRTNAFRPTLPSALPWPLTTTGITQAGELIKYVVTWALEPLSLALSVTQPLLLVSTRSSTYARISTTTFMYVCQIVENIKSRNLCLTQGQVKTSILPMPWVATRKSSCSTVKNDS